MKFKSSNSVLIDGLTLHVACLSDITPKEYWALNTYAKNAINTLVQTLIIHDVIRVGSDVISPRQRFPELFKLFHDCIFEVSASEIRESSESKIEVIDLYNQNKEDFLKLNREENYENELTNFVQNHFFFSGIDPTENVLYKEDPELFEIFINHQKLRIRLYNLEASINELSYLPSPFRKKLSELREVRHTLAYDIIRTFENDVRSEILSDFKEDILFRRQPYDIETPPLVQFLLEEGGNQSIIKSTHQLRHSPEAKDFRQLCSEMLNPESLSQQQEIYLELKELKNAWRKNLGNPNLPVKKSNIIRTYGFNENISNRLEPQFKRRAYLFIHKIINRI